jgi:hypothetical protein
MFCGMVEDGGTGSACGSPTVSNMRVLELLSFS